MAGLFPDEIELRLDAAMAGIGFVLVDTKQVFDRSKKAWVTPYEHNPRVLRREYERGGFRYNVTVTVDDIARHGEESVVARAVDGASRRGRPV